MYEDEIRKIGKPRVAEAEKKKKRKMIIFIVLLAMICVFIVGAYELNIIKLKGEASDVFEPGDRFCLGDECFYTVSDNNDGTVTALAQYNLLVGYYVDTSNGVNDQTPLVPIDANTEGYGRQNKKAVGFDESSDVERVGVIPFESPKEVYYGYWWDKENSQVKEEYADKFPYVLDSNSELYAPLQNYKTILANDGYNVDEVTLLTKEQAETLGCDASTHKCNSARPWITKTSFWLNTAKGNYFDWAIQNSDSSHFNAIGVFYNQGFGVRPVITVNKNQMPEDRGLGKYSFGDLIDLDGQQFYVLEQQKTTITMLAQYNLLVGYNVTWDSNSNSIVGDPEEISPDTEGYGLQNGDVPSVVINDESVEIHAGVPFIDYGASFYEELKTNPDLDFDTYWWDNENEEIYRQYRISSDLGDVYDEENCAPAKYLKDYKNTLSKLGYKTKTVRLFNYDDLRSKQEVVYTLDESMSWFNDVAFMTSMVYRKSYVVTNISQIPAYLPFGIRPVVVMDVADIDKSNVVPTTKPSGSNNSGNKDSLKELEKYIKNDNTTKTTTTVTTTSITKKAKNFNNKIITTNTFGNKYLVYILAFFDIVLLIIAIALLVALVKNKKKKTK